MSEEKKKPRSRQWDGKSRVSTDLYRKNFEEIFGKVVNTETASYMKTRIRVRVIRESCIKQVLFMSKFSLIESLPKIIIIIVLVGLITSNVINTNRIQQGQFDRKFQR